MTDKKEKQPLHFCTLGSLRDNANFKHSDKGVSFEIKGVLIEIDNKGNATYEDKASGDYMATDIKFLFGCFRMLREKP